MPTIPPHPHHQTLEHVASDILSQLRVQDARRLRRPDQPVIITRLGADLVLRHLISLGIEPDVNSPIQPNLNALTHGPN